MPKKIFIISILSLILTGCSLNSENAENKAKKEFSSSKKQVSENITNNLDNIANKGEKVEVHYTGRLENGEVFDSSHFTGRKPLTFSLGKSQMIPGFEQGILGMKIGETKTVNISPKNAYGKYNEELVQEVAKDRLKVSNRKLKTGAVLTTPQGRQVTIKNIGEEKVTLDMNHKLAGEKLIFDINLIDIKK